MKVKKGHNYQPHRNRLSIDTSGQAMKRPGLTVARDVVALLTVLCRER